MAWPGQDGGRRGELLDCGDAGAGPGKPLSVARLLADDTTADALETDLLRHGVDLLDLYRGTLSFRRVCAVVANLPDDAAVWRAIGPDTGWSRSELVLAVMERRVTLLWATVAQALGHTIAEQDLIGPLDATTTDPTSTPAPAGGEPETKSLREIALWMRGA